jgi:2-hydroxychromene-2-carboxylate isomerase
LPLLRLALAAAHPDEPGCTNRYVTECVMAHVWQGGADALDPARLAHLQARLTDHMSHRGLAWADPDGADVKQQLRANTDEALSAGAFGVPTLMLDGRLFWGLDGLPMLRACLEGDAWFASDGWTAADRVSVGVVRRA